MAILVRLYRVVDSAFWWAELHTQAGKLRICTNERDEQKAQRIAESFDEPPRKKKRTEPSEPDPGHTVADALHYFLSVSCKDLAPETQRCYAHRAVPLKVLSHLDVNRLTVERLYSFCEERTEEGAARETVRKELTVLKLALQLAERRGLLWKDPRRIMPKWRAPYVPKDRYLEPDELARLLAALRPDRRLWVAVAVLTGGRDRELQRLAWEGVDWSNGTILVPGTKTPRARRRITMPAELRALLESAPAGQRQGLILPPWTNRRRDLAQACARAGLAPVTPNDLRRTYASLQKNVGVDSAVLAQLLGHTSTRMVDMVYGRLNLETLRRATDSIPSGLVLPAQISWQHKTTKGPEPQNRKR